MFRKFSQLFMYNAFNKGNHLHLSPAVRQFQSFGETSRPSSGFKPLNPVPGVLNQNFILDPSTSLKITIPGRKSFIDSICELPLKPGIIIDDIPLVNNVIEDPNRVVEKQAARLVVIRRRKMKRHRLKKLRKRMKFVWGKVRQKREMRKEKAFQAELLGQIKEAKKFDPAAYTAEKIKKANEVLTPTSWKGKRLPEFIIKEMMTEREQKIRINLERAQRRKHVNLDPSHYKY